MSVRVALVVECDFPGCNEETPAVTGRVLSRGGPYATVSPAQARSEAELEHGYSRHRLLPHKRMSDICPKHQHIWT